MRVLVCAERLEPQVPVRVDEQTLKHRHDGGPRHLAVATAQLSRARLVAGRSDLSFYDAIERCRWDRLSWLHDAEDLAHSAGRVDSANLRGVSGSDVEAVATDGSARPNVERNHREAERRAEVPDEQPTSLDLRDGVTHFRPDIDGLVCEVVRDHPLRRVGSDARASLAGDQTTGPDTDHEWRQKAVAWRNALEHPAVAVQQRYTRAIVDPDRVILQRPYQLRIL